MFHKTLQHMQHKLHHAKEVEEIKIVLKSLIKNLSGIGPIWIFFANYNNGQNLHLTSNLIEMNIFIQHTHIN